MSHAGSAIRRMVGLPAGDFAHRLKDGGIDRAFVTDPSEERVVGAKALESARRDVDVPGLAPWGGEQTIESNPSGAFPLQDVIDSVAGGQVEGGDSQVADKEAEKPHAGGSGERKGGGGAGSAPAAQGNEAAAHDVNGDWSDANDDDDDDAGRDDGDGDDDEEVGQKGATRPASSPNPASPSSPSPNPASPSSPSPARSASSPVTLSPTSSAPRSIPSKSSAGAKTGSPAIVSVLVGKPAPKLAPSRLGASAASASSTGAVAVGPVTPAVAAAIPIGVGTASPSPLNSTAVGEANGADGDADAAAADDVDELGTSVASFAVGIASVGSQTAGSLGSFARPSPFGSVVVDESAWKQRWTQRDVDAGAPAAGSSGAAGLGALGGAGKGGSRSRLDTLPSASSGLLEGSSSSRRLQMQPSKDRYGALPGGLSAALSGGASGSARDGLGSTPSSTMHSRSPSDAAAISNRGSASGAAAVALSKAAETSRGRVANAPPAAKPRAGALAATPERSSRLGSRSPSPMPGSAAARAAHAAPPSSPSGPSLTFAPSAELRASEDASITLAPRGALSRKTPFLQASGDGSAGALASDPRSKSPPPSGYRPRPRSPAPPGSGLTDPRSRSPPPSGHSDPRSRSPPPSGGAASRAGHTPKGLSPATSAAATAAMFSGPRMSPFDFSGGSGAAAAAAAAMQRRGSAGGRLSVASSGMLSQTSSRHSIAWSDDCGRSLHSVAFYDGEALPEPETVPSLKHPNRPLKHVQGSSAGRLSPAPSNLGQRRGSSSAGNFLTTPNGSGSVQMSRLGSTQLKSALSGGGLTLLPEPIEGDRVLAISKLAMQHEAKRQYDEALKRVEQSKAEKAAKKAEKKAQGGGCCFQ